MRLAARSVEGLREQLAAVGAKAVRAGLVLGSGGNLSARLGDDIVVTASGTWLDELEPSDFSVVAPRGTLRGGNPSPTSELALHLATYAVRPDVSAIVHLHPQMSVLLDALDQDIRLITIDHAYYVREVRRTPYRHSGTQELADISADAVRDGCNCVILAHHGCSVLGDSVELAAKRAFNLEEAARATYSALLLGNSTVGVPPSYLARIAKQ